MGREGEGLQVAYSLNKVQVAGGEVWAEEAQGTCGTRPQCFGGEWLGWVHLVCLSCLREG